MKYPMRCIVVLLVAAVLAGCGDGVIPVLKTYEGDDEIDKIRLPEYSPAGSDTVYGERYNSYGTQGSRINHEDIYIKNSYRTSDDVIHIILGGEISNGIPEGLLWNENKNADFGVPSGPAGYSGRGDVKIGTLGPETGGSAAIGSPDFSAEWVMGGPYTAVVLVGLVDNVNGTTVVIEKNESLNLLSSTYRKQFYPDAELYSISGGKLQKNSKYADGYDSNNFRYCPDGVWTTPGAQRGGYPILISKSKKAAPYIVSFDVEYSNKTKKRYEVDYSAVRIYEIKLTSISFQSPTPIGEYTLEGGLVTPEDPSNPNTSYIIPYSTTVDADKITIDVTKDNPILEDPLLLRPLYNPVDEDPRKITTNMINDIYLTDTSGNPLKDDNLVLTWNDQVQAITLYIIKEADTPEEAAGNEGGEIPETLTVRINASLRLPFDTTYPNEEGDPVDVTRLTCDVTINP
jgi:hypothetical protein